MTSAIPTKLHDVFYQPCIEPQGEENCGGGGLPTDMPYYHKQLNTYLLRKFNEGNFEGYMSIKKKKKLERGGGTAPL